ncbi:MAG: type VI secretion system tube protein Hcp [Phenylobacterium sp.]|uniref:type VI secretion system tube protein Hcp n=1 Tax=Phenylobacterium sp. TaxID=1871053 RepID=UPI0027355746|nr:type VI secretion system tube protein Hcp [Phenylobacterium sp.]MDP3746868.1 type VI secretion system tube protein Hcp [Phenylobacterium sp.]
MIQVFTTTASFLRKPVALATLAVGLLVCASAAAASDYLLELDGVKGEPSVRRGTLEIDSFGWGVGGPIQSCHGRSGRGEATLTGPAIASDARLVAAAASGKVIPRAKLFARKSGSESTTEIKLEKVMVSSLAPGGRTAGEVRLSFANASWSVQGCRLG